MSKIILYIKELIMITSGVLGIATFVLQPFLNISLQWSKIIGFTLLGIAGVCFALIIAAAVVVSRKKSENLRKQSDDLRKKQRKDISDEISGAIETAIKSNNIIFNEIYSTMAIIAKELQETNLILAKHLSEKSLHSESVDLSESNTRIENAIKKLNKRIDLLENNSTNASKQ